jgi:hypothetical protein
MAAEEESELYHLTASMIHEKKWLHQKKLPICPAGTAVHAGKIGAL